ncbi:hypothetical protein PAXRUDRAFT_392261 [Paxillus rubicundulus Ve08.2h10]|uniref:Uncharacterized protein n=1 Tax=Paxillus rubicundulus Ve08.2h10 TaxID=930991 RepID=A0A0D0C1U4_9AGAM|nr:hypothetical protein PAXRUDRAFT_392261 [Paxillus rubicundulus Ve08.2h10]
MMTMVHVTAASAAVVTTLHRLSPLTERTRFKLGHNQFSLPPIHRLPTMKTFLTLLSAITSLSVCTLQVVGVYGQKCAACPVSVGGRTLNNECLGSNSITKCEYQKSQGGQTHYCHYDKSGSGTGKSDASCPNHVQTGKLCGHC